MNKDERQKQVEVRREQAAKREALKTKLKMFGFGIPVGIALTLVAGFWNGWIVTGGNAERMAQDAANQARVTALVPYCVDNFKDSKDYRKHLASLKATSHWSRGSFIGDGGWSKSPDGEDAGSLVRDACADKILADAAATEKAATAKAGSTGG